VIDWWRSTSPAHGVPAAEPDLVEQRYSLAGLQLSVSAEPVLAAALDARLQALTSLHSSDRADLRFAFVDGQASDIQRPSGPVRHIYEPSDGEVLYAVESDRVYLELGDRVRAVCDPVDGVTRVAFEQPRPFDRWLLSHPVLTLPLLESMKRRGLFGVHAAGLARDGRGLLIGGSSGAGKSTLALALARAGFDFLGDDTLFLSTTDDGVCAHAFPDQVDVTTNTVGFFPELSHLLTGPRLPGWPKWSFRAEDVYPISISWTCAPAVLILPCVTDTPTSRLEPLSPPEALLELVPNILLTEPTACQAHLETLARLTNQASCFRLWTGLDFEALPLLLGNLLE
jgi:hypothetical protein